MMEDSEGLNSFEKDFAESMKDQDKALALLFPEEVDVVALYPTFLRLDGSVVKGYVFFTKYTDAPPSEEAILFLETLLGGLKSELSVSESDNPA